MLSYIYPIIVRIKVLSSNFIFIKYMGPEVYLIEVKQYIQVLDFPIKV